MEDKEEITENSKLSYEQLNEVAMQLSLQNQQYRMALQEANISNMFKRLDYLFKVVELSDKFSSDFVSACIAEIKEIITIPKQTDEEDE